MIYGDSIPSMIQSLRLAGPHNSIDWRTRARCLADLSVAERILSRSGKENG